MVKQDLAEHIQSTNIRIKSLKYRIRLRSISPTLQVSHNKSKAQIPLSNKTLALSICTAFSSFYSSMQAICLREEPDLNFQQVALFIEKKFLDE